MPQQRKMINKLDHVNIRTNRLQEMVEFYSRVLNLTIGPRPDFAFDGAWLYCSGEAIIHLVQVTESLVHDHVQIEHFALKSKDFHGTREHLTREGVDFKVTPVPGYELTQIHLADVDGNHIELNFDGCFS